MKEEKRIFPFRKKLQWNSVSFILGRTVYHYKVRPNKKETRFISEISSLPRKI